jgi:hypothetical protein
MKHDFSRIRIREENESRLSLRESSVFRIFRGAKGDFDRPLVANPSELAALPPIVSMPNRLVNLRNNNSIRTIRTI